MQPIVGTCSPENVTRLPLAADQNPTGCYRRLSPGSTLTQVAAMAQVACSARQAGWGAQQQQRRRQRQRNRQAPQPPQALFQSIFKWPQQEAPGKGGLVEKPLYRPQEMVQMGPFKVSPMGFGTWSWVRLLLPLPPLALFTRCCCAAATAASLS